VGAASGRGSMTRESHMSVRARMTSEVLYGHFAEYLQIMEQLDELAAARGWRPAQHLTPLAGKANRFETEIVYDSLAEAEQEQAAFYADADAMKLLRASGEHIVQGSTYIELLETAPQLA
jgi:hypothetical protein